VRHNIRVHSTFILPVVGLLAVACVYGVHSFTREGTKDTPKRGFRATDEPARVAGHGFVAKDERGACPYETPAKLPDMNPIPQQADNAEFADELLDEAADVFTEMATVGGRMDTPALRNELADRLLAANGGGRLLERVVTDLQFARHSFGVRQAEARHFAALALGRGASQGNTMHLRAAITGVSAELHRDKNLNRGRAEDLRALLIAYTNAPDSRTITASSLPQIGYDAHMAPAMRQLYQEALLFGFWRQEGYEAAQAHLKSLFPET
jgi:hypothetical protein